MFSFQNSNSKIKDGQVQSKQQQVALMKLWLTSPLHLHPLVLEAIIIRKSVVKSRNKWLQVI